VKRRARGRPPARPSNGRPRAVTYHRVSTVDQHPENARDELRRAVALRQLDLVEEVEETGSGRKNDRPGLQRVLELVRAGDVEVVVVWKLSRFGRSALDLEIMLKELEAAGVTFVATSEGIEVGRHAGPMAHLMRRILAAFAEFERETISENTVLGLEAARRRGVKLGRPRKFGSA
jgi:putative DNA-invertase from lambdoid prophage Rac